MTSTEVAKELAEALRDLRSRINETRGQNATDAVLRIDAALAKYDAEQGKAEEPEAWKAIIGGTNGKTPFASELFNFKEMAEAYIAERPKGYSGRIVPLYAAPAPAPSAVRAPAVVAAQGVMVVEVTPDLLKALEIECERAIGQRDKYKETGVSTASHGGSHDTCFRTILESFAATRAQQGDPQKESGHD